MSVQCKKCSSTNYIKNGIVRKQQRYRCKSCGCNFITIDRRQKSKHIPLKVLCVLIYSLGKGTYRTLGEICGVAHTTVYRWIRKEAAQLPEPKISMNLQDVELDEMWHFLDQKKQKMDLKSSGSLDAKNNCMGHW